MLLLKLFRKNVYFEILAIRVIAAVFMAILLLQTLRHQTNYSTGGLLIAKILWIAIIVLSIFFCLGLRMADSDPIQFNPHQISPDEIQAVAREVLVNKQNLLRLNDFYTFIPIGFCFGIVIYGILQIVLSKRRESKSFEENK